MKKAFSPDVSGGKASSVCRKAPGLIRALIFNPALTTCASERMKTQRFSYFADFAARRPAAVGQFRPVSRGGTSCFLREAKPVKLKKVAFSHFFDTLNKPFGLVCSCQLMVYFIKA